MLIRLHPTVDLSIATIGAVLCLLPFLADAQDADPQNISTSTPPAFTLIPPPASGPDTAMPSYLEPFSLDERRQARVTNLAANMSTRFDRVVARYDQIIGRLEVRLAILGNEGRNVTPARIHLETATSTLATVRLMQSDIDARVAATVSATDVLREWRNLRGLYSGIHDTLRQVDQSLRKSVAAAEMTLMPAPTPAIIRASSSETAN